MLKNRVRCVCRLCILSLTVAATPVPSAAPPPALPTPLAPPAENGQRGDKVRTSQGHIFTPAVANIPGIGLTYGLFGSVFCDFGPQFSIVDQNGDVRLSTITKTGVAEPEKEGRMGQVVQDVLVGTGEVAKSITSPLPPAHEVVSGTVDATTGATGSLLSKADNKVKTKF